MPLGSIDMPSRYLSRFNIHILKEIQLKWRWWWWWCLSQFSTKHVSLSTYEAPCEHVAFTKKNLLKKIGDQEFYGVNQHVFFKGHPVIQYIMVHPILWVCQPIELSCAPLNSTCVCFAISGFSKNPAEKNTEFIITFPLPSAKQPWLAGRSITRMTCHLNGENLWKSSNYRMFHCYLWLPEGGPDWWEELRHLIEGLQAPSESRQAE